MTSQHIHIREIRSGPSGAGVVELNRPEALNALSESMLRQISNQLTKWDADEGIHFVFIHSNSSKAFCAGGDVKALIQNKISRGSIDHVQTFFTEEYFTDCLMHHFRKPVIGWLDGICMGGGVGLTQGAAFRIATERTVMSMPEVFIGFFPDVGATHFLPKLGELGLFLGLTGCRFSGAQAAHWGLATHLAPHQEKDRILSDLIRIKMGSSPDANRDSLARYLKKYEPPPADLPNGFQDAEKDLQSGKFDRIVHALKKIAEKNPPQRTPSLLSQSAFLRLAQLNHDQSWPNVFMQEWATALRFSEHTEFTEGVRSLLIAKEPQAHWPERSLAEAWSQSENLLQPYEPNLLRQKLMESREKFGLT